MRIFLFSRRFLIPLFIFWVLHLAYLGWEVWNTWGEEFTRKGISSSLIAKFLFVQVAGYYIPATFLIAFLMAMVFYSHHFIKKYQFISKGFFSVYNLSAVVIIALVAFLFSSFTQPQIRSKSQGLLADIVYAKSSDELPGPMLKSRTNDYYRKTPETMTLPELFSARDSLKSTHDINDEYDFPYLNNSQRELDKIRYEIGKKISLPLNVIVFYLIAIFLAASFYKLHVIVPLLVGYFLLLVSWYYIQQIFERLYYNKILGIFFAAGGTALLFLLFATAWFFVLKKYGLFKKRSNDPETQGSIDFENNEVE